MAEYLVNKMWAGIHVSVTLWGHTARFHFLLRQSSTFSFFGKLLFNV